MDGACVVGGEANPQPIVVTRKARLEDRSVSMRRKMSRADGGREPSPPRRVAECRVSLTLRSPHFRRARMRCRFSLGLTALGIFAASAAAQRPASPPPPPPFPPPDSPVLTRPHTGDLAPCPDGPGDAWLGGPQHRLRWPSP